MNYFEELDRQMAVGIDTIKLMLHRRHPGIFQRLDFNNDAIYLEPLFYTYARQPDDKWLDSIIYGYETVKKNKIFVFSNSNGIIYLPAVGYLHTAIPGQTITMETIDGKIVLSIDEKVLDYTVEDLLYSSQGIEIVKYHHPLLSTVFTDQGYPLDGICVEGLAEQHVENFNKGLELMEEANPPLYRALMKNLKKAMFYNARKPNSFAVITAQNMVFLNVNSWDTDLFFLDHVSHEGSHVLFFTLTYISKKPLFTCDNNTPFADVTGYTWDNNTVYLRFHGLFTYLGITTCLEYYIRKHPLPIENYREACGRFIFHMLRFKLLLDAFAVVKVMTDEGRRWYGLFLEHYNAMEQKSLELTPLFSLKNQPYDFNSRIFAEVNPVL